MRWTLRWFIAVLQWLAAAPTFHMLSLTNISRLPAPAARALQMAAAAELE
jgi:hypothetical protein